MIRDDAGDLVFKNEPASSRRSSGRSRKCKRRAGRCWSARPRSKNPNGWPDALKRRGIEHRVLNAKHHEREAAIVADAGNRGAVTIATNMAGRGTDIVLGRGVAELGGLHIIGTERHESRRIDNQLRGRSGRQGDPGSSRFYRLARRRVDAALRRRANRRPDGAARHGRRRADRASDHLASRSRAPRPRSRATTSIAGSHVVQYDDVMNRHREVIYADRRQIVTGEDMYEKIDDLIDAEIEDIVDAHIDREGATIDSMPQSSRRTTRSFPRRQGRPSKSSMDLAAEELVDRLTDDARCATGRSRTGFGPEIMRKVERHIMLAVIDSLWVEHLTEMDDLREGVGLQAYGQRDPLVVYKTEGYRMFEQLLDNIQHDVVHAIYRVQPVAAQQPVRTRITEDRDDDQCRGRERRSPRSARPPRFGRTTPAPAVAARSTSTATAHREPRPHRRVSTRSQKRKHLASYRSRGVFVRPSHQGAFQNSSS